MLNNSLFISDLNKNLIKSVYSKNNVAIEICENDERASQQFHLVIEKHKIQNAFQIRLINAQNKTNIFISIIDDHKFEKVKIEQSLRVTFEQFLKHITQMLEQCATSQGKFHLQLILSNDNDSNYLQFYEQGTFKNLIHLTLDIEQAPLDLILFYVNESLVKLQEQNRQAAQKANALQAELGAKEQTIDRLNETISKLKLDINDQEKMTVVRYKEQLARMEQDFKHVAESKDFQRQELEKQLTAFRTRNDTLIKENYTLNEQLKKEGKQKLQLQNEFEKLQYLQRDLSKETEQYKSDQSHNKSVAQKYEHIANDLRKQIQSLEDKNHLLEKQNSEISAELDAERNICQIKRNGLKIATEDICNANTIIRKQLAEIAQLQEKLQCRTQIVLEQERVIRENGSRTGDATALLETIDKAIKGYDTKSEETLHRLKDLQSHADMIERKYQSRISDIQNKISSTVR